MLSNTGAAVRLPRLEVAMATVMLALALIIRFAHSLTPIEDPDLWLHLAAGRWMFEHGTIPTIDPFSTGSPGREWLNYCWSIDLAWWAGYRVVGLASPLIYASIFQGLVLLVCMRLVYADGSRLVRRAFLAAVGFLAIGPNLPPRTYLVTFVFTGVTLLFVRSVRQGASARRGFWLIPMFAIWANTHIEFIYGLFFLGLAGSSELIAEWQKGKRGIHFGRRSTELFAVTIACAAATVANPFGWRLHASMARLALYFADDHIFEFQSMPFRSVGDYLVLTLFAAAVFVMAQRRNRSIYDWGALVVGAYLSFHNRRSDWLVVWVSLDLLRELPLLSGADVLPARRFILGLSATTLVVVACFAVALVRTSDRLAGDKQFPFAAAQFAREHELRGPLFNDWNWGDFLRFQLPEIRGTIDGRGPLYSHEEILASMQTWRGGPEWAKNQKLDEAGFVMANVGTALAQLLRLDSRFRIAYEDAQAAIFVREPAGSHAEGRLGAPPVIAHSR
jgi:hypothetical protein